MEYLLCKGTPERIPAGTDGIIPIGTSGKSFVEEVDEFRSIFVVMLLFS